MAFKSMLRRKGVRVVSITEHADDSPTGKLMEAIIESVDEFYSRKSSGGSSTGNAGGRLPGLLGRQPGALRLSQADGPGRGQEAPHIGARSGLISRSAAHSRYGLGRTGHPGHYPHPERRGHRQPHRPALVQERRPHHPEKLGLHRHPSLGRRRQGQGRPGPGGEGFSWPDLEDPVPQGEQADEFPRPQEGSPPPRGKLIPPQRPGQVPQLQNGPCPPRTPRADSSPTMSAST